MLHSGRHVTALLCAPPLTRHLFLFAMEINTMHIAPKTAGPLLNFLRHSKLGSDALSTTGSKSGASGERKDPTVFVTSTCLEITNSKLKPPPDASFDELHPEVASAQQDSASEKRSRAASDGRCCCVVV